MRPVQRIWHGAVRSPGAAGSQGGTNAASSKASPGRGRTGHRCARRHTGSGKGPCAAACSITRTYGSCTSGCDRGTAARTLDRRYPFVAQIKADFTGNPAGPSDGLNFGQLFTDHASQVQLNQILLTANKPLDLKNPDYQWGFKLQLTYGSDARYTQFLGELNRVDPTARYQLDIVEANALAHLPWLTEGAIDLKSGRYPTPLATRRSIPRPIRSTHTHVSSSSACPSSARAR